MISADRSDAPFRFATVAHLESPVGRVAHDLATLREGIAAVPEDSLFHHVTRLPVRYPRAHDLPANDFARWVATMLQAPEAAERLALVGSGSRAPLEALRASLLDVLDGVSARDRRREAAAGALFHFLRATSVVVPLEEEAANPREAVDGWMRLEAAAIFYHLIEAPLRGDEDRSLSAWLRVQGAERLAAAAEEEVAEWRPIERLRRELGTRWRRSQLARRLAERAEAPEAERLNEARRAMARLAGRLRGGPPTSKEES